MPLATWWCGPASRDIGEQPRISRSSSTSTVAYGVHRRRIRQQMSYSELGGPPGACFVTTVVQLYAPQSRGGVKRTWRCRGFHQLRPRSPRAPEAAHATLRCEAALEALSGSKCRASMLPRLPVTARDRLRHARCLSTGNARPIVDLDTGGGEHQSDLRPGSDLLSARRASSRNAPGAAARSLTPSALMALNTCSKCLIFLALPKCSPRQTPAAVPRRKRTSGERRVDAALLSCSSMIELSSGGPADGRPPPRPAGSARAGSRPPRAHPCAPPGHPPLERSCQRLRRLAAPGEPWNLAGLSPPSRAAGCARPLTGSGSCGVVSFGVCRLAPLGFFRRGMASHGGGGVR